MYPLDRRSAGTLLLLALVATSGCNKIVRRPVREDRGPLLLEVAANPVFDADASEVFFCEPGADPGSSGVYRALRIADGQVRDVHETCDARIEHVAPDGSAQWLGIESGPPSAPVLTLRELLHGGPDLVLTPAPTALAFSPAGDALLYYQADRGTTLRQLGSGAEVAIPCYPPFAFSPGGDELVCERPWMGKFLYARLRLSDLQYASLEQPDPLWGKCCDLQWTDRGLRLSAQDGHRVLVFDPTTGEARTVEAPQGNWVELGPHGFTPDGRGYVLNEVECLSDSDSPIPVCSYYESRYVLVDLDTGQRRTIASGETPELPTTYYGELGAFAVSPDSRFLTYSIDRSWYWRPTGR